MNRNTFRFFSPPLWGGWVGLPLLLFLSSCLIDKDPFPAPEEEPAQELWLNIQVPGLSRPFTKGLTEAEESQVQTLDILVFEQDGSDEKYAYHTTAQKIENTNNDPLQYTFAASLQASRASETYRFVLLANLAAEIDPDAFTTGDSKESVLKQILFTPGERWGDDKIAGTSALLPMWGESAATHKVDDHLTASQIGTIPLLRSVARINIGVRMPSGSDSPQGLGNRFYLEEIRLYNINRTALPAPAAAHLTGGTVTAPTLPAGGATTTLTHTHIPADLGFINEIYVAETSKSSAPTILVGGYYTAPGAPVPNQTKKSWYKLVLYDHTQANPFSHPLDILRNHYYRINITSVNAEGYATAAEALNNPSANLEISLAVYDEDGEINYVVYNNHYMLGVSLDEIKVGWTAQKNSELKLLTDYESGWSYEITDSPKPGGNPVSWIKNVTGTNSPAGQKEPVSFEVEEGASLRKRVAYIHFTAGTLRQPVKVVQSGLANSYFLKPGETLEIPVRKAYVVWADEMMGDQQQTISGAVTTSVVWQDVEDLVTVNLSAEGDQGDKSKLVVTAHGIGEGNAVVGVSIGGTLRYSWHVWVTPYDPDRNQAGTTYPYNNGYQDYLFMDRNLGATTSTPGEASTLGNYYQWGRKDPFPGPNAITGNTQKTIYGTQIIAQRTSTTTTSKSSNNIHNVLLFPSVYYFYSTEPYDWYTTRRQTLNYYLWSDENGEKGVFDPCPDGWRVPVGSSSPWTGLNTGNFTWDTTTRGGTYTDGNFYPASGYRDQSSGVFKSLGSQGYSWTAYSEGMYDLQGYNAVYLLIFSGSVNHAFPGLRTMGIPVRCVKE